MYKYGIFEVSTISPIVHVANPRANSIEIEANLKKVQQSDIVAFPELCITGYSCGDLFKQTKLIDQAIQALFRIACRIGHQLVFVGCPVPVGNSLYNCVVALNNGSIVGIVPKSHIPNYKEFYEGRWFRSAGEPLLGLSGIEDRSTPKSVRLSKANTNEIPFGTDLLFSATDNNGQEIVIGAEDCEDLWGPIPPSSMQALAGATILVNLSASNETVGKAEYRRSLVAGQSARCTAAYIYASSGPSESVDDIIFSGHSLIAENGVILGETTHVGNGPYPKEAVVLTRHIDVEKLLSERRTTTSFGDASKYFSEKYRRIEVTFFGGHLPAKLIQKVDGTPFIPKDPAKRKARCQEVFGIQTAGLIGKLQSVPNVNPTIGVSGGLDSTLALVATVKAMQVLGKSPSKINAVTMPGFGTTKKTYNIANVLMQSLGVNSIEIDIRSLALAAMKAIGHKAFGIVDCNLPLDEFEKQLAALTPEQAKKDLVFENAQARARTYVLMSKGFVVGTGDLTEAALGWMTYNGDHMSMYNPNATIPKGLVRYLVDYLADEEATELSTTNPIGLAEALRECSGLIVSPELLLAKDGEIAQSSEDMLGPYELHEFYMYYSMRFGFSPEKLLWLASNAEFTKEYSEEICYKTLQTYFGKLFSQQFKRNCVPNAPKVGSVSYSPRGDFRMPSDADGSIFFI